MAYLSSADGPVENPTVVACAAVNVSVCALAVKAMPISFSALSILPLTESNIATFSTCHPLSCLTVELALFYH